MGRFTPVLRRGMLATAVGVVLGLLLWWWMRVPVAVPAPQATAVQRAEPPAPPPALRPMPPAAREPVPEGPPSVVVQALEAVATYAGEGVVRCALPAGFPEGHPFGTPPGFRDGDVFTMRVAAPAGQVLLQVPAEHPRIPTQEELAAYFARRAEPPVGLLVWQDAFPGELGRCWVEPLRRVRVPGHVVFLDGWQEGAVNGCGAGVPVDENGRFELDVLVGAPCTVEFRSLNLHEDATLLDPANPPDELVVYERPPMSLAERLEIDVARAAYLVDTPDPVALALADGGHSPEVRAVLEAWAARDAQDRAAEVQGLSQSAEDWRERNPSED